MATDDAIREILTNVRTIAMVGASANPDRPSHGVMRFLLDQGYHVIPVNPGLAGQQIHGQTVVARLADVAEPVDMVEVFRRSEDVPAVAEDAIAIHAKVLWTQLGVVNETAAQAARAAGLSVVMDHCPAIEIPRLGLSKRS
jgi:uncharacterized protein